MILHFKWTISKGRDTYGYNICTLYVDGIKVSSCNGGGYDLMGTCLGNYLESAWQSELRGIADNAGEHIRARKGEPWERLEQEGDLYGMKAIHDDIGLVHVSLDGSCGFRSMEKIAGAMGLELTYMQSMSETRGKRLKNDQYYSLTTMQS